MRSRLERPAGLEDSTTVYEPPNCLFTGYCRGPERDRGVARVHPGGDLVAVARARGHDLELGAAAPRRRLSRRSLIRRRLNSAILRRPLHVLRRPHDCAALMPVAVFLRC